MIASEEGWGKQSCFSYMCFDPVCILFSINLSASYEQDQTP